NQAQSRSIPADAHHSLEPEQVDSENLVCYLPTDTGTPELDYVQDRISTFSSPLHHEDPQPAGRPIGIPRQVGLVAGVAIAVTAGTISQVVNQAPEYEGNFQLAVQPEATAPETVPVPQIENTNQRITETQLRILQSPRLLDPVIERLQADNPKMDYYGFIKNLHLQRNGDHAIEVSYRDIDPQRVKLVLEQLAQTYVQYSQECRDGACQGLKFVEAQVPQVQQRVENLRTKIEQFHQQHGLNNLEAQVRLFTMRSTEIAKQSADLQGKLAEARQQNKELQLRMALKPEDKIAENLLKQDQRYQALLNQFQTLDRQLAQALSRYEAEDPQLKAINAQHQQVVAQLHQEAAQILPRQLANPTANLQDPIFQDPKLLELLQQAIQNTHYIQLLEVRQQTLGEAQQILAQQKQELATILRQYGDLRQQLQSETQILQQYIDQRDLLRTQAQQQQFTWTLASTPDLVKNASGEPVADYFHSLKEDVGSAAILGVLLGLAVAIVQEEKRRNQTSPIANLASNPANDPNANQQRLRNLFKQHKLLNFKAES
ncbi:MAG TPA: hypothetical protein V6C65_12955, partial [Allocoleopsis sp.]